MFDGDIGHTDLSPWVKETTLPGAESTSATYLNHGNGVTSSVLFGPIDEGATEFPRPYANVPHYRCISPALQAPAGVPNADLYDVLKHIDQVLKTEKPSFVNLSIGPYMPMDDDLVHPWTALIDSHLASGQTLAAVAVGNDGEKEWPESRVQPPLRHGQCDGGRGMRHDEGRMDTGTLQFTWTRPQSRHGEARRRRLRRLD